MSERFPALTPGIGDGGSDFVTRAELLNAIGAVLSLSGGTMEDDINMGGHDLPNLAKFWSDNWDGAIPPDLSGGQDATATKGVAYDGKAGAFQALAFYGVAGVPTGTILPYGGSTAPTGYVLADGTAYDSVSDTTYAPLYTAIGNTFGGTDGTDFQVPDLRGRFPFGKATSGTGSTLGGTFGSIDHTHTNPNTSSGGAHTHVVSDTTSGPSSTAFVDGIGSPTAVASAGHTHTTSDTSSSNGSHSHSQGATGSNNPPGIAIQFIVKL